MGPGGGRGGGGDGGRGGGGRRGGGGGDGGCGGGRGGGGGPDVTTTLNVVCAPLPHTSLAVAVMVARPPATGRNVAIESDTLTAAIVLSDDDAPKRSGLPPGRVNATARFTRPLPPPV